LWYAFKFAEEFEEDRLVLNLLSFGPGFLGL